MNRHQRRADKKADPQSFLSKAIALHHSGDLLAAEAAYRKILICDKRNSAALCNLGILLHMTGRFREGVATLQAATKANTTFPFAHEALGTAYSLCGDADNAADSFFHAATRCLSDKKISPDIQLRMVSRFLSAMLFSEKFSPSDISAAARASSTPFSTQVPWRHDNRSDKVLKIGYVAPMLCAGALAPYLEPVFRMHDRTQFSVHVYAGHIPTPDATTSRIRNLVDSWTDIEAMSDDEACELIRRDCIDILVDPIGHFEYGRMGIFARKPAPIQVSYLCQGLTTGLPAMDYAIGDRWMNAGGAMQTFASEQVIELESGFQVTSFDTEPEIGLPPILRNGFITFGSFNNPLKISNTTLSLWSSVLAATPGSKLLIKGHLFDNPEINSNLRSRLESHGIFDAAIIGRIPGPDHLLAYNDVDIVLDTTPFTGGRTTLDALWMGTPVVTLQGACTYGRYSSANMTRMGLSRLIAKTPDEYVEIATMLADKNEMMLNSGMYLRETMRLSLVMNATKHVRELEESFRMMWARRVLHTPHSTNITLSPTATSS